jgi:hypothetical protein
MMAVESSESLLKSFMEILDHAVQSPPPKQAGLDGRKGLARRMTLSIIDDILRIDGNSEGADWSPEEVALLKEKALNALKAMNDAA